MQHRIGACLLASLVVLPLSQSGSIADEPIPLSEVDHQLRIWADGNVAANKRIEQALSTNIGAKGLQFEKTPLDEVLKSVGERFGLEIRLDRRAFDDLSLFTHEPINVRMRNVSLRSALKCMLLDLDLTYVIDHEMLLITSVDEASARTLTAVYPVGDLVDEKMSIDDLVELITSCADDPGGWDCPVGYAQAAGDRVIVVVATQTIHESVGNLLQAIRVARKYRGERLNDQYGIDEF